MYEVLVHKWIGLSHGLPTNKASVLAVHDHVTQGGRRSWEHNGDRLAFFLPTTSTAGRGRWLDLETYGNIQSRAIFRGGGPFMLPDSPNLTAEALRRLGFLDDGLNGNLAEAMLVFANLSDNKNTVRRLGMLPDPEDKSLDVERKLRSAFLSTASPGKWCRNETALSQKVLQTLERADMLPQKGPSEYSHEEIFEAMKSFVSRQKLPRMHTFNGLRFRIRRYIERKNPSMRKEVDFRRWWHSTSEKEGAYVHNGPFRKFSAFPVSEPCVQNWQRRYVAVSRSATPCPGALLRCRGDFAAIHLLRAGGCLGSFFSWHQTSKTTGKNLQSQHLKTT